MERGDGGKVAASVNWRKRSAAEVRLWRNEFVGMLTLLSMFLCDGRHPWMGSPDSL